MDCRRVAINPLMDWGEEGDGPPMDWGRGANDRRMDRRVDGNDGLMDCGGDWNDPPMDWGDGNDLKIDWGRGANDRRMDWRVRGKDRRMDWIGARNYHRIFEKKQKMTIRSTFQTVIQNILDESIANFVLTAAATWPALSFEAGKNRRHWPAHLERGCGKNVSRDEGHQNGAYEQAATANRIFALSASQMSPFIGAQKTVRATNNFSYFFLHLLDQKCRYLK